MFAKRPWEFLNLLGTDQENFACSVKINNDRAMGLYDPK